MESPRTSSTKTSRERFASPSVETRWEKDLGIVKIPALTPATADALSRAIEEANRAVVTNRLTNTVSSSTSTPAWPRMYQGVRTCPGG